jgi:hypothetical protein
VAKRKDHGRLGAVALISATLPTRISDRNAPDLFDAGTTLGRSSGSEACGADSTPNDLPLPSSALRPVSGS